MDVAPELVRSRRVAHSHESNVDANVFKLPLEDKVKPLSDIFYDVLYGSKKLNVDITENEDLAWLHSVESILYLLRLIKISWNASASPLLLTCPLQNRNLIQVVPPQHRKYM